MKKVVEMQELQNQALLKELINKSDFIKNKGYAFDRAKEILSHTQQFNPSMFNKLMDDMRKTTSIEPLIDFFWKEKREHRIQWFLELQNKMKGKVVSSLYKKKKKKKKDDFKVAHPHPHLHEEPEFDDAFGIYSSFKSMNSFQFNKIPEYIPDPKVIEYEREKDKKEENQFGYEQGTVIQYIPEEYRLILEKQSPSEQQMILNAYAEYKESAKEPLSTFNASFFNQSLEYNRMRREIQEERQNGFELQNNLNNQKS